MRIQSLFFILFIALLGCSCSKKEDSGSKIKILVGENTELIRLQNMIDTTRIVQLESNESALLANIEDVFQINNRIYILDNQQNAVYMYDYNGKYLNKYDKQGGAEFEYTSLCDWAHDDDFIYLLDFAKILVLDYNLNFIQAINTQDFTEEAKYKGCDRIEAYKDELYIYDDNSKSVFALSKNGQKSMRHILTDQRKCASVMPLSANEEVFHKVDNDLFIVPGRSDCIYRVIDKDVELFAQIDYDRKESIYETLGSQSAKNHKVRSKNVPFSIHNVFKANGKLYMFFPDRGGSYLEIDTINKSGCEYVGYKNGMNVESDHPFWDSMDNTYWYRFVILSDDELQDSDESVINGMQLTNYHKCKDELLQFLVIYELSHKEGIND